MFYTGPEYNLQTSWLCGSPEVLMTMIHPEDQEIIDAVDYKAQDAYSLGCLLVSLLTGKVPFRVTDEEKQKRGLTTDSQILKVLRGKQKALVSMLFTGIDCVQHLLCDLMNPLFYHIVCKVVAQVPRTLLVSFWLVQAFKSNKCYCLLTPHASAIIAVHISGKMLRHTVYLHSAVVVIGAKSPVGSLCDCNACRAEIWSFCRHEGSQVRGQCRCSLMCQSWKKTGTPSSFCWPKCNRLRTPCSVPLNH